MNIQFSTGINVWYAYLHLPLTKQLNLGQHIMHGSYGIIRSDHEYMIPTFYLEPKCDPKLWMI